MADRQRGSRREQGCPAPDHCDVGRMAKPRQRWWEPTKIQSVGLRVVHLVAVGQKMVGVRRVSGELRFGLAGLGGYLEVRRIRQQA